MNALLQVLNKQKLFVALLVSAAAGTLLMQAFPFPLKDPLLQLIAAEKPHLWKSLWGCYAAVVFITPWLLTLSALSTAYVYFHEVDPVKPGALDPVPPPEARKELFAVLGELHRQFTPEPSAAPKWLVIPERGLYTGLLGFGAIGTGKRHV